MSVVELIQEYGVEYMVVYSSAGEKVATHGTYDESWMKGLVDTWVSLVEQGTCAAFREQPLPQVIRQGPVRCVAVSYTHLTLPTTPYV